MNQLPIFLTFPMSVGEDIINFRVKILCRNRRSNQEPSKLCHSEDTRIQSLLFQINKNEELQQLPINLRFS